MRQTERPHFDEVRAFSLFNRIDADPRSQWFFVFYVFLFMSLMLLGLGYFARHFGHPERHFAPDLNFSRRFIYLLMIPFLGAAPAWVWKRILSVAKQGKEVDFLGESICAMTFAVGGLMWAFQLYRLGGTFAEFFAVLLAVWLFDFALILPLARRFLPKNPSI